MRRKPTTGRLRGTSKSELLGLAAELFGDEVRGYAQASLEPAPDDLATVAGLQGSELLAELERRLWEVGNRIRVLAGRRERDSLSELERRSLLAGWLRLLAVYEIAEYERLNACESSQEPNLGAPEPTTVPEDVATR